MCIKKQIIIKIINLNKKLASKMLILNLLMILMLKMNIIKVKKIFYLINLSIIDNVILKE